MMTELKIVDPQWDGDLRKKLKKSIDYGTIKTVEDVSENATEGESKMKKQFTRNMSVKLTEAHVDILESYMKKTGKNNMAETVRGLIDTAPNLSLTDRELKRLVANGDIQKIEKKIEESCQSVSQGIFMLSFLYGATQKIKKEITAPTEKEVQWGKKV